MDSVIGCRIEAGMELSQRLGIPLEVRRTAPPRPFSSDDWRIVRVRTLTAPDRLEVVLAAFVAAEDVAN